MRLNIDRDLVKQLVSGQLPNKSRHLEELTHEPSIWQCDTAQWLSCFDSSQLTILWMANIMDLPRHAWDTPPFPFIVSPTLPVQSVDAYERTLGQSRDNQTKRGWPNSWLTIFYEYGALSHARFAREGAPLKRKPMKSKSKSKSQNLNPYFPIKRTLSVKTTLVLICTSSEVISSSYF